MGCWPRQSHDLGEVLHFLELPSIFYLEREGKSQVCTSFQFWKHRNLGAGDRSSVRGVSIEPPLGRTKLRLNTIWLLKGTSIPRNDNGKLRGAKSTPQR